MNDFIKRHLDLALSFFLSFLILILIEFKNLEFIFNYIFISGYFFFALTGIVALNIFYKSKSEFYERIADKVSREKNLPNYRIIFKNYFLVNYLINLLGLLICLISVYLKYKFTFIFFILYSFISLSFLLYFCFSIFDDFIFKINENKELLKKYLDN